MIKIRDGSIPRYKKTYTCWIGNITSRITKSQIENDLNIYCEKFGRFKKPINIRYTDFLKKYQCFIEYYNKQFTALSAVNYFRDMNYYNYKLKARYIHEIDTDPPIDRNVFVKQLYLVKSLVVLNSKYLQQQVNKKVEILNIYNDKLKINIDNSGVEPDFILNLKTLDESIFNQVT
jgi:hypothetical protein